MIYNRVKHTIIEIFVCKYVTQGSKRFPKIFLPTHNTIRQIGDKHGVPYKVSTNMSCHWTKHILPDSRGPWNCVPL